MRKTLGKSKGIAILTVMIVFLTIFIVLSAIMMIASNNQKTTLKGNNYSNAYYVAESALNIRSAQLKDIFYSLAETVPNPDPLDLFTTLESRFTLLPATITFPETTNDDSALLTLTPSNGSDLYPEYIFYTLTSTSDVNGVSRTLSKELGFNYSRSGPGLIIGKAVLTQRGMQLGDQKSTIIGPVASNVLDGTFIEISSTQDQINMVFVPAGRSAAVKNPSRIGNRITEMPANFIFPVINFPIIPATTPTTIAPYTFVNNQATINVFNYSYLENLTMADGQTVVVNLGSRGTSMTKKMLVVKNINASGKIRVIGTGRLLLVFEYGNGTMDLGPKFSVCGNVVGACLSATPDYTKFLFYLRTPHVAAGDFANYPTLGFSNLQLFYGSILAQFVNIDVKSANFKGHIVTAGNFVNFSANAIINGALFYAPFATLTIDSNAELRGSLVGNYFIISNPHTVVQYIEVDKESFPFSIDFPVTEQSNNVPGSAETIEGAVTEN